MGAVVFLTNFFVAHPPESIAPVKIIDIARVFIPSVLLSCPGPNPSNRYTFSQVFILKQLKALSKVSLRSLSGPSNVIFTRLGRSVFTLADRRVYNLLSRFKQDSQRKESPWTITPLIEDSSCNTRPKLAQRWEWLAERSERVQANRRRAG